MGTHYSSEIEKKWQERWDDEGTYKFDPDAKGEIYAIDTPPPFTSGTLHMGHIYNHVWIDMVARYKRMRGFNVCFPQGFDCHGLPTELKVEKEYGVSKDDKEKFIKKCREWTASAVKRMMSQFRSVGYSTDWTLSYKTMDDEYKSMVQNTLIDFYRRKMLYKEKHPILWCWECRTALAKAEVGYVESEGELYYIDLDVEGGHKITIATTRPELMPACVAVLVHPEDKTHERFVGKKATLPLFGRDVPILSDSEVDRGFGTGVVYVCTFGDEMDIKWQKKLRLPVVIALNEDGTMSKEAGDYAGLRLREAKEKILGDLTAKGYVRKVEKFKHNVLSHTERTSCMTPIELLPKEQWFIRVRDFLGEIKKTAQWMKWYPDYMLQRLEDWADSMDWDWIISRQRTFGTPLPFWTCKECGAIIVTNKLPADPRGTTVDCKCGGKAVGETDVCDCWVDSSVTPLVVSRWQKDPKFFKRAYPTALRPQGYEIIRTWSFYTIFRCLMLTGKPCFRDLMINGMVAGPDGKKMSKSLGNVIEPEDVLAKYPADALRQWAAAGTLGEDYPFFWDECEHSQKFLTKLLNIGRFISGFEKIKARPGKGGTSWMDSHFGDKDKLELRVVDRWILSRLQEVVATCNKNLDLYVFNAPLQSIRNFVWHEFADFYVELIKHRLYKPEEHGEESKKAALYTVNTVMETILKLMAPITPHISEELYRDVYGGGSVHLQKYPQPEKGDEKAEAAGGYLVEILAMVRKMKADKGMSLGKELGQLKLQLPKEVMKVFGEIEADLKGGGRITNLEVVEGKEIAIKD